VSRVNAVLVVLLLAVAAASGTATALEQQRAEPPAFGAPSAVTPVLSARRVPTVIAAPVADRRLRIALDELLADNPATACLTVTSGSRTIHASAADAALVPASLQKLLVAAAALEVLGPDFRYLTRVVAAAAPEGGVVRGHAWVIGGGDPLLATAEYVARFRRQPQIVTRAEALAAALADAGVTTIEGTLFGDESRYDRARYVASWPERYVAQDQTGPLSALTVNDNWVAFPPNADTTTPDEEPAPEPPAHVAAVFAGLFGARGIVIGGGVADGVAPEDSVELAAVESPPLTDVLTEMLRESDNQTAELLLKELAVARGRPPTTADGAAVVAETLAAAGYPGAGTIVVVDGSGLAEGNHVPCTLLQAILDRSGPDGSLAGMLAVAGVNGTLDRRFVDSPVAGRLRAKTGTLNHVTALAGYLQTVSGTPVAFTYVANLAEDDAVDQPDIDLQSTLVDILDLYPQTPPLAELEPLPVR
jgi:D-alanyl-D-alanine carboxypeptidase/D-alanyl-D-alanine-endopeptidase (penicillin-binding protein 4)